MKKGRTNRDDGLFGSLFDLNGDGKTDVGEAALMFMMFDELQQEEHTRRAILSNDKIVDLDDLDIEGI